jgi:DNA-binding CsgD family transcriptional regulator
MITEQSALSCREASMVAPIADAMDSLRTAVFLLDAGASIAYTNASGQDILSRNDFLRSVLGRLVAADPIIDRAVREAVISHSDGAIAGGNIALPFLARDGERFVGHLLPLAAGRRRQAGFTYDATAVLFVSKASFDVTYAPQIIKDVFRLTPAELRVLLAIAEIGGVAETAKSLDVAESTIKTHLGRIYTKTATRRQADLVRLLATYSSPLREIDGAGQ